MCPIIEFGPAVMTDEWRPSGVVHGVGQVAQQDHVLAIERELAQAERAAGDAHVCVDACQQDILNPARFEEVPDFLTAVGNRVLVRIDGDRRVLPEPRAAWVAADAFKFLLPRLVLLGGVILAAIAGIDRVTCLLLLGGFPIEPLADAGRQCRPPSGLPGRACVPDALRNWPCSRKVRG